MSNPLHREWLTEAGLVALQLATLPKTQQGINKLILREKWRETAFARRRKGRGGGWEYHINALPEAALKELLARRDGALEARLPPHAWASAPLHGSRQERRAMARVVIVRMMERMAAVSGEGLGRTFARAADAYNRRSLPFRKDIYEAVERVSPASLWRWRKRINAAPAAPRGGRRRKRTRHALEQANGGEVALFVQALILGAHKLSAAQIRDQALAKFGSAVIIGGEERPMPSLRAFHRYIKTWTAANAAAVAMVTDPDRYKNHYRHSGGTRDPWVKAVNDLWEIDATPADVMTTDGRVSVYVCVDAFSRRMMAHVSRTPRTQERNGHHPPIDSLLAATTLHHGLRLVTRNERDFAFPGIEIINPWK